MSLPQLYYFAPEISSENDFKCSLKLRSEKRRRLSKTQTSLALRSACTFFEILGQRDLIWVVTGYCLVVTEPSLLRGSHAGKHLGYDDELWSNFLEVIIGHIT